MVKNKHILFADFPEMGKITPEAKQANRKRIFTGGVRIGNGMYRSDEEASIYQHNALKRRLP